jgi:hypothetical protein
MRSRASEGRDLAVEAAVQLGDAHEGERGVVAVRGVGDDELEVADRGLALPEAGEEAPEPAATGAIGNGGGDAVLLGDHRIELLVVRVVGDDLLVGIESLRESTANELDLGGAVAGLGAVDRLAVGVDDPAVELDSSPVVAVLLGGPRPVHEIEGVTAFLAGEGGDGAALDLPAGAGGPDELGV